MPRILACPSCRYGSSQLADAAAGRGRWDSVMCPSCGAAFEIAEGFDEAFAYGAIDGYLEWTGGIRADAFVKCRIGTTSLFPIHGRFSRVHRIVTGVRSGSSAFLAGGLLGHFIPQGYLMVALAPSPEALGSSHEHVDVMISVIGSALGAPDLPVWRRLMLDGQLAARSQPELTLVNVISAIDLFLEQASKIQTKPGRPGSWEPALRKLTGTSGRDLLGERHSHLKTIIDARNAVAHGKSYIDVLPSELAEREVSWRARTEQRIIERESPVALFALSAALCLIRKAQRVLAIASPL